MLQFFGFYFDITVHFCFAFIDRLGPLVHSWCMRYEARHPYFKQLAIRIGNSINLPFSLTKRHQEGLCYRLISSAGGLSSFIEKGIEVGPGTAIIGFEHVLFTFLY